jgi:hypothetical protein
MSDLDEAYRHYEVGECAACVFEATVDEPQDAADVAECEPDLLCARHKAVYDAYHRRLFGREGA